MKALEGKYFLRMRSDEEEEDTVYFSCGKVVAVEKHFLLIRIYDWEEGVPIFSDECSIHKGLVLHHLAEVLGWDCRWYSTQEEVVLAHDEMDSEDENDEFAKNWEAKMEK